VKVVFLVQAQNELDDAVVWYNLQAAGLERELLDELDRAIRRAVAFPLSYPEIEPASAAAA
jgi:hypothetical protein